MNENYEEKPTAKDIAIGIGLAAATTVVCVAIAETIPVLTVKILDRRLARKIRKNEN